MTVFRGTLYPYIFTISALYRTVVVFFHPIDINFRSNTLKSISSVDKWNSVGRGHNSNKRLYVEVTGGDKTLSTNDALRGVVRMFHLLYWFT